MAEFDMLRTPNGNWVSPAELHRVLLDDGYSGGERMQFLKSLLAELTANTARRDNGRGALLTEVREILEQEQNKEGREPIAKGDL